MQSYNNCCALKPESCYILEAYIKKESLCLHRWMWAGGRYYIFLPVSTHVSVGWLPILYFSTCVYAGECGLAAWRSWDCGERGVLHCLIRSKTRTHILVGATQEHNSGNDTQWCSDWGRGLSGIADQARSLSVQKCSDVCRFLLVTFHFKVHAPDVKIFRVSQQ